jgi:hypothetical protein
LLALQLVFLGAALSVWWLFPLKSPFPGVVRNDPGCASKQWLLDWPLQQLLAHTEAVTAIVLVAGGPGVLERRSWSPYRVRFLLAVLPIFVLLLNWIGFYCVALHGLQCMACNAWPAMHGCAELITRDCLRCMPAATS